MDKMFFSSIVARKFFSEIKPGTLTSQGHKISQGDVSAYGECIDEDFIFEISQVQIDKMVAFLKLLSEQPILLGFDTSTNWIFIKEAII